MSDANRCPECGAKLPFGALAGLCPKCLLAAGLESAGEQPQAAGGGSEAPTTPHGSGFVPPEPSWLAAYFPQLEILELLGCGGMGAVYKARQLKLDRLVALKIIRPESADAPAFAERFNREARMLARLSHPHIVGVYDFGSVAISLREMNPQAEREGYTELYYFLMEYVDGANLRELMRSGELTPEQALGVVPPLCEALQFAHDEGVVHRDIKPENILLDKKGRVKIADFGLAKLAASSPQEFTLTATHQVMGTPHYMAPEQMEGSRAVDHRADIYSLGVVFYEMLTGEVPAGHFEPPSKKVEIDVRLDQVVLRAMAREPERRYQQAREVKTDIEVIAQRAKGDAVGLAQASVPNCDARFPWAGLFAGMAVLLPFLGVIAFAMYWTGSVWPLSGLAVVWFALGIPVGMAGGKGEDAQAAAKVKPAFYALMVIAACGNIALAGYGVVLINSASPLWSIVAGLVALVISIALYAEVAEELDKGEVARSSEVEKHPAQGKELVETPALLMTVAGAMLTGWLALGVWEIATNGFWSVAPCVVGPVILIAGLFMRQLRYYWLAVVGSLLCLPAAMFPFWGWLALGVGVFSLWRLMQPEVREAFQS